MRGPWGVAARLTMGAMATADQWLAKLARLKVYRARGGKAPHKPLLLLVLLELAEQGLLPPAVLPLKPEGAGWRSWIPLEIGPGRAFDPEGLPTLPGPQFIRPGRLRRGPTRDDGLDFAPGHAPPGQRAGEFRPGKPAGLPQSARRPETDIVVVVRRRVPVTVGRTHVHRLIVERAATQDTATRPPSSGSAL
jgi:hypothetical protein